MDSRLVKAILAGVIGIDSLTKEELNYVQDAMELIKNAAMGYPDLGAGAGAGAGTVAKFDSNGQWSIEKAIKPGPALNYKVLNKPVQQAPEDTQTITYHETKSPEISGKQWKTSDTKKIPSPEAKTKIAEKKRLVGQAIAEGKVLDSTKPQGAIKETASETIKRRSKEGLVKAALPKICVSCLKDEKHRDNPGTPKLKEETKHGKWWDCPTCKTTGLMADKSPEEKPKTSLRVVKEEG